MNKAKVRPAINAKKSKLRPAIMADSKSLGLLCRKRRKVTSGPNIEIKVEKQRNLQACHKRTKHSVSLLQLHKDTKIKCKNGFFSNLTSLQMIANSTYS
jgi:hypothetical protein